MIAANKKKLLRRLASLVAVLLLIAAVVPFVIYAFPMTVGADHSYVVLTPSMEPDIAPGDVVIVQETVPSSISVGDVITYGDGSGEMPVTHRVVGVDGTGENRVFITQGDANEDPDQEPIPAGQVIGSVILVIPYLGYVIQFANSNLGFAALVVAPIVLFVLNEIWMLVSSIGGRKNATDSEELVDRGARPTEMEDASGDVTLTATDLNFSLVILIAFTTYGAYIGYLRQTAITVAVAVGVGATLLLTIGLRLSMMVRSPTRSESGIDDSRNRNLGDFVGMNDTSDVEDDSHAPDADPLDYASVNDEPSQADVSADGGEVENR